MTPNSNLVICEDKIDMSVWKELKYIQGAKKGQRYRVPKNKVLKLPLTDEHIGNELRIFVERPEMTEDNKEGLNDDDIKQLYTMLTECASIETFQKWIKEISKNKK